MCSHGKISTRPAARPWVRRESATRSGRPAPSLVQEETRTNLSSPSIRCLYWWVPADSVAWTHQPEPGWHRRGQRSPRGPEHLVGLQLGRPHARGATPRTHLGDSKMPGMGLMRTWQLIGPVQSCEGPLMSLGGS